MPRIILRMKDVQRARQLSNYPGSVTDLKGWAINIMLLLKRYIPPDHF